jgi:hypothetical protein
MEDAMKKFLVLYHMPASATAWRDVSQQDAEKEQAAWMSWAEKCGTALVDMGSALGNGVKLKKSGSTASDRDVTGFSVLQAEDIDAAKSLIDGHPHLAYSDGCEIEVHEYFEM